VLQISSFSVVGTWLDVFITHSIPYFPYNIITSLTKEASLNIIISIKIIMIHRELARKSNALCFKNRIPNAISYK
jgi:hypothetical protein